MTEKPVSSIHEVTDDAEARQYLHEAFDVNVCIEAGAGTGKTTTIIDRVVTAFERGIIEPSELVLMTFTEAAAAELERRVRELLLKRIRSLEQGPAEVRLRSALEHLPEARIGTIHSVAEGILQQHAHEAGLPGMCSIIPPLEYRRQVRSAFESWMEMLQSDPEGRAFLVLSDAFGITRSRSLEVLTELLDAYDAVPHGTRIPSTREAEAALVAGAADVAAQVREALACFGTPPAGHASERMLSAIAAEQVLHDISQGRDAAAYLAWWIALPVGGPALGSQKDWSAGGGDPTAFREGKRALGLIRDAAVEHLATSGTALLASLVGSLAYHVRACAADRKAEGLATFHDLLVWTRDLLQSRRDVLDGLRSSCRMIIIDEFQDTDPIQVDIVLLLAGVDDPTGEASLPPGRLTIVGDPKQSIYRFRDADLRMFARVRNLILASGGTLCTLSANFRSHEGLLRVVNEHFARAMGDREGDVTYRPLQASRTSHEGAHPPPQFIGDVLSGNVSDRVGAEARGIAVILRELMREDPGFRLGDCCIIVRTRTHLYPLQKHLEDSGIPSLVASGSLVLLTGDLRDMMQLLRAVAEPGNVPAVVGTLKSRVFACADTELLAWHARHGSWEYRNLLHDTGSDDHVGHSLGMLQRLHERCGVLDVDAQIEVVLASCMLRSDAALHRNALERTRRYAWLVRMARAYVRDRPGATLAGFVDLLEEMVRRSSRDALPLVTGPEADAVRIMTVHEAKGLEFPTVILAGMQDPQKSRTPPVRVLIDRTAGRFAVALSSGLPGADRNHRLWFRTAGFDDLDAHAVSADADEDVRLLYVAMTRPRERLVVSMFRTAQPEERQDLTLTVARSTAMPPGDGDGDVLMTTGEEGSGEGQDEIVPDVERHHLMDLQHGFEEASVKLHNALARPASYPITAVIHDGALETEHGSSTGKAGAMGPGFGTFVHACIRQSDLTKPAALSRAVGIMLARDPSYRVAEQSILGMVEWAAKQYGADPSIRLWHEVPVSGVVGELHLHGVIDMVYEQDGKYVVVDFKTDFPSPERMLRQSSYVKQLALYAALLEQATGRIVLHGELAYLADHTVVALSRDELVSLAGENAEVPVERAGRMNGSQQGN